MEQCPLCYTPLQVQDCAPCYDCGADSLELDHLAPKIHTYQTFEVMDFARITLCNFCQVDIGAYSPSFWGSQSQRISFTDLTFVKEVERPMPVKDKVCPSCNKRLKFLQFVNLARDRFK